MTKGSKDNLDFSLPVKLSAGLVLAMLIFSVGVLAFPAPEQDMINTTAPAYYEMEGPYRLTYDSARSVNPWIAIDAEDNMHMLWDDGRNDPDQSDTSYIHEIFYKKLDADGNVLVNDTRLNDNTGIDIQPGSWYSAAPKGAMDSNGNIHIAYLEYTRHKYAVDDRINVEIYYMKIDGNLDEGGEPAAREDIVLVDEQRVSTGPAHSGDPDIEVDSSDNVHIVWYDHRSAYYNWEIYYEKLSKSGSVLIDDKRLTYYMDYNAGPELAIDSNDDLHIMFKNYVWSTGVNSVYYMKVDDNGDTLVAPKKVATEGVQSYQLYSNSYAGIAIDSADKLHIAWNDYRDGTDQDVFYLKLDNEGDAMMSAPLAITDNAGVSYGGGIAVDASDRAFVAFQDNTPGYYQLFIAVINTDGSYHLEPYQVTVNNALSSSAAVAFDSENNAHLVFVNTRTWDPELYHLIMKPLLMKLGFVAYGMLGSRLDITIYEDGVEVASGMIVRQSSDPKDDMFSTVLEINLYASYELELKYTPVAQKGKSNAALNLKVYVMNGDELGDELANVVMKNNPSKNSRVEATYNLDDDIAAYFGS